jgi:2-methylisocitrate lyase-like PEP mutase family enzyme
VPIGEFQGKLAAAKAGGAVLVIARTEALIAGLGQDEALRRGEAYAEAGADGVLIHSKQKTPDEILAPRGHPIEFQRASSWTMRPYTEFS